MASCKLGYNGVGNMLYLHVGCTCNKLLYPIFFALDSKCAHYITKFICFVYEANTKCHLGWANEKGSTLKAKGHIQTQN
jgi:hypothetical protein